MPDLPTLPTHTRSRAELFWSISSSSAGHALVSSRYAHSVVLPPMARIRYSPLAGRSLPRIPFALMVKCEGSDTPGMSDGTGRKTMAVPGGHT